MFIYAEHYEAYQDDSGPKWSAPIQDGCVGLIDLRTIPEMSQIGGIAQGFGLFMYDSLQPSLSNLLVDTDRRDTALSRSAHNVMEAAAKCRAGGLKSTTFAGILEEMFTSDDDGLGRSLYDPSGDDRVKPIRFDNRGRIIATFGGITFINKVRDDSTGVIDKTTIEVYRADYRRQRQAYLDRGELDVLRKFTTATMQKLRIKDPAGVIPPEFSSDGILPRASTISADFDETDDTNLSAVGWTEVAGDWETQSNRCYLNTASVGRREARFDTALTTDDHQSDIVVILIQNANFTLAGSTCRFSDDADPNEDYYCCNIRVNDDFELQKLVNGTSSDVATTVTQAFSTPDTIAVSANGVAVKGYYNGTVLLSSDLDTSITGNLKCGVTGFIGTASGGDVGDVLMDDFLASDVQSAVYRRRMEGY